MSEATYNQITMDAVEHWRQRATMVYELVPQGLLSRREQWLLRAHYQRFHQDVAILAFRQPRRWWRRWTSYRFIALLAHSRLLRLQIKLRRVD